MSMPATVLGDSCLSPVVIEVVESTPDTWLVRTRYEDGIPTNHYSSSDRSVANAFAMDLRDLTADMMVSLVGFPARVDLAEGERDVP